MFKVALLGRFFSEGQLRDRTGSPEHSVCIIGLILLTAEDKSARALAEYLGPAVARGALDEYWILCHKQDKDVGFQEGSCARDFSLQGAFLEDGAGRSRLVDWVPFRILS